MAFRAAMLGRSVVLAARSTRVAGATNSNNVRFLRTTPSLFQQSSSSATGATNKHGGLTGAPGATPPSGLSSASRADSAAEQAVSDADHNATAAAEAINDHDRPKGTGGAKAKGGDAAALNDLERDASGNLKVKSAGDIARNTANAVKEDVSGAMETAKEGLEKGKAAAAVAKDATISAAAMAAATAEAAKDAVVHGKDVLQEKVQYAAEYVAEKLRKDDSEGSYGGADDPKEGSSDSTKSSNAKGKNDNKSDKADKKSDDRRPKA